MQHNNQLDMQVEVYGKAAEGLQKRIGDFGNGVNNALNRYFAALAEARKKLITKFSANECGLMVDACCSTLFDDASGVREFPYQIEDAIAFEYLDVKWGVDGRELVEKLNALNFIERAALVDAIERWWQVDRDVELEFGELLTWE